MVLEKKIFKTINPTSSLSFPLWRGTSTSFVQTWKPIPKGCFVPSLVEIGSVVLGKKIFKTLNPIFTLSWLSTLWRGNGPLSEQTRKPFTKGCFVLSFVEIGKEDFENINQFITLSLLSPLWRWTGPSVEIIWKDLPQRMPCVNFGPNWLSGSGEDEIVKSLLCCWWHWRQKTDKFWSEKLTWAFNSDELKREWPLPNLYAKTRRSNVIKHRIIWL